MLDPLVKGVAGTGGHEGEKPFGPRDGTAPAGEQEPDAAPAQRRGV